MQSHLSVAGIQQTQPHSIFIACASTTCANYAHANSTCTHTPVVYTHAQSHTWCIWVSFSCRWQQGTANSLSHVSFDLRPTKEEWHYNNNTAISRHPRCRCSAKQSTEGEVTTEAEQISETSVMSIMGHQSTGMHRQITNNNLLRCRRGSLLRCRYPANWPWEDT